MRNRNSSECAVIFTRSNSLVVGGKRSLYLCNWTLSVLSIGFDNRQSFVRLGLNWAIIALGLRDCDWRFTFQPIRAKQLFCCLKSNRQSLVWLRLYGDFFAFIEFSFFSHCFLINNFFHSTIFFILWILIQDTKSIIF